MSDSREISLNAQRALRSIRALRNLPETSGTIAAERKVLNQLNGIDTLAVALALAAEDQNEGAQ